MSDWRWMAERAAPRLDTPARDAISAVMVRCADGDFDDDDPPARVARGSVERERDVDTRRRGAD